MFAVGLFAWLMAGFFLGFADVRDWFLFSLCAVALAWVTAKWLK
jgi:hypothetical protein